MISRPVPFPLHPILRGPDGEARCGCGWAECSRIGKHPLIEWRDLSYGDEVPLPVEGAGVGLKTGAGPKGSDVIVVDLDGEAAIDAWLSLGGFDGDTRVVQTGRGEDGLQLYFEHPGFPVRNSVSALGPGIDIRGDGGYAVLENSPHASGNTYLLLSDEGTPPAPAPAWLADWLRAQPAPTEAQRYDGDVSDPDERDFRRSLYADYLKTTPKIRCDENRGRGDVCLFDVVQYGAYDLRLPTEDVLDLVREHYDPRNDRPWGNELEERVHHKAHDAKMNSTRARLEPPPNPKRDPELAALLAPEPEDPNVIDFDALLASLPKPANKRPPKGLQWGGWDEPVAPPTWLVHGLIPIETVGLFVAMGSSLKTWAAIDIAIAVARGQPWLGRYPTRKGKVVLIDWESGDYELRRRVRMLAPDGDIEDLGRIVFHEGGINDEAMWRMLMAVEGLQLIVIDSLAAGDPLMDENSLGAALPLAMAGKLAEGYGISTLVIHHSTKGDGGGDARKTVRGHGAIFAAVDWAFAFENDDEVTDVGGGSVRRMKMVCTKPCQSARPAPVQFQLSDATGLTWFDEDDAASTGAARAAVARGERSSTSIQTAIKLALEGGAIETKAIVAKKVGVRAALVSDELDALEVRREVRFAKGLGYVLDSPEAREGRVVEAVKRAPFGYRSEAALAASAEVDTKDVTELMLGGRLAKGSDGQWLVLAGAGAA